MRVAGDPDGCAALARELGRAASGVAEAGAYPERTLLPPELWSGAAARSWQQLAVRRAVRAGRLADQLSAASRSLADFAGLLAELQQRAARLTAAAAEEGLALDPTGDIPPVPVPLGPQVDPHAMAEQQRARHRADVRERLLGQVALLRDDEEQLHRRLSSALGGLAAPGGSERWGSEPTGGHEQQEQQRPDPASRWAPAWADASAVLGLVPTQRLSDLSLAGSTAASKGLALVRTVPGMAVLSAGVGVVADRDAGYSLDGAVVKQAVVTTASAATGVAAAAAVGAGTVLALPAVATVAVGAVAAAAVGYAGSRAYDAAFGPGPAPGPIPARARRSVRPAGPARSPSVRPALPDPTCGQGPVLSQVR